MVVRLILKIHQPFLRLPIYLNRNDDRAGVNFIRFLLIFELSFFLEAFHRHQSQIHQAYEFILPTLINILKRL